jgi:hypothetical protein
MFTAHLNTYTYATARTEDLGDLYDKAAIIAAAEAAAGLGPVATAGMETCPRA